MLAVKYGHRVTSRAESYLNFHLYGEPDADLDIDYYFWVIRDARRRLPRRHRLRPRGRRPPAPRALHHPGAGAAGLGIAPDDVTAIVITHAHWDHVGNVRQFPRAQVVMTEAEYAFWTSPLAARAALRGPQRAAGDRAAAAGPRCGPRSRSSPASHALAPGIELIEVGGHTPGQLIASVASPAGGTVVLASDALHFYEEVEQDRPFAVLADLPAMYRAYDTLAQLAAQPGTHLVAGHDPDVRARFARCARPRAAAATAASNEVEITDLTRPLLP